MNVILKTASAERLIRALETDAERGETLLRAEDRTALLGELRAALSPACPVCQGAGRVQVDDDAEMPCPHCDLPQRLAQHTRRMRSAYTCDRVSLELLEACGLHIARLEARLSPGSNIANDRDMVAQAKAGQLA